jgi:hypothetical protein
MFSSRILRFAKQSAGKFLTSTLESPKVTIVKNILLLKKISAAKDDAALAQALAAELPTVDSNNLPDELKEFHPYLALSNVSKSEKFVPDPSAWQNMSFFDFALVEGQRAETWPFFVGLMYDLF